MRMKQFALLARRSLPSQHVSCNQCVNIISVKTAPTTAEIYEVDQRSPTSSCKTSMRKFRPGVGGGGGPLNARMKILFVLQQNGKIQTEFVFALKQ